MTTVLRASAATIQNPLKLLRGGTVLVHGDHDRILPQKADVLIEGDRISKIDATISAPDGCYVIDCSDKIISPGFVDTHHHVWQSPLKGLFGDTALFSYLAIGSFPFTKRNVNGDLYSPVHAAGLTLTPDDMFWANLAGSLEAVDAGTTTTLDHAHMNWSKEHSMSRSPMEVRNAENYQFRSIGNCRHPLVRHPIDIRLHPCSYTVSD